MCSSCLNIFCGICIDDWIAKNNLNFNINNNNNDFYNNSSCVNCRKTFIAAGIPKSIMNTIDKLIYKCPNFLMCRYENNHFRVIDHILNCDYNKRKIYCKSCYISIEVLDPKQIYNIIFNHYNQCGKILVNCEFCELVVLREELDKHKLICLNRREKCSICSFNIIFKDLESHLKNECFFKIKESYEKLINEKNVIIEDLKNENNLLKNKIEELFLCQKKEKINNEKIFEFIENNSMLNSDIEDKDRYSIETLKDNKNLMEIYLKNLIKIEISLHDFHSFENLGNKDLRNSNSSFYLLDSVEDEKLNDSIKIEKEEIFKINIYKLKKESIFSGNIKKNKFNKNFMCKNQQILTLDFNESFNPVFVRFKNGNRYFGYIKNNKLEGNGILYFFNGLIYRGSFNENKIYGKGCLIFPNGSKLIGSFENGEIINDCLYIFKKNSVLSYYYGSLKDFSFTGKAKLKYNSGSFFIGNFKDGLKDGISKMYNSNGNLYEGSFSNNEMEGDGSLIYGNGDFYKGEFKNSLREGKGFFKSQLSEMIYEGDFQNDEFHGKGVMKSKNNQIYNGNFKNGISCGEGLLLFDDQSKFEGEFYEFKLNGFGKVTTSDGSIYGGIWENGVLNSEGFYLSADQEKYEGEFKNNLMHGFGNYYFKNGDFYEGEFFEGKKTGRGKIQYANGEIFEGSFVEDKREGYGIHYGKYGEVFFQGYFRQNLPTKRK